jgi:4'-phosphopantetheinyl transferase EntD
MPIDTQFGESRRARPPNPARVSPGIEALFPPGVAAAELRGAGDASLLEPEEADAVARAIPARIREFAAGRLCARSALERLGVSGFALRAAPDRRPMWPEGLVGSITHTRGFCAAVAADRARFTSLGLDTEIAGAVKEDLWPRICIEAELKWIESLPRSDRTRAATLVFCAKEAFYKCQYPHTREWLGFSDLCIAPEEWAAQGAFTVEPQRSLAVFGARDCAVRILMRYRFHEEFLSAGVALSAES